MERTTPDDPRRIKVNVPLRFLHEVLGLEHLHYGLWNGEPLDLEGLKKAQERYLQTLVEWIPEGVESVLDVGCGSGATSRELLRRGFAVEGLSPDPYQQELYRERVGRPFHLARFQDFRPERRYDLVLMSESAQYVWLDSLFPAVRRAAPGGHLLLADYFVVADEKSPRTKSGHPLDVFRARAREAGLELEREEDVTERATPTLELAQRWLDRYVDPSLDLVSLSVRRRHPWLHALGRRLLRRQLTRFDDARELIDADTFRALKRYYLMRFRVPAATA